MHKVYFRFYEELNDFLPQGKRKMRFEHSFTDRASVKDMIEALGVPHSEVDLILVNGKSVDYSYKVNYNDDISVYPVFESFDISGVQHLRAKPLREPKFALDVHLGKLAKYMRMLGLDTYFNREAGENDLIEISLKEKRTIITQNRNLLKRKEVTHGYWVRSREITEQIEEIISRFQLEGEFAQFSRCMVCNEKLKEVKKESIVDMLPERVRENYSAFKECPGCRRIFWKGSHYSRMKETTSLMIESVRTKSLRKK